MRWVWPDIAPVFGRGNECRRVGILGRAIFRKEVRLRPQDVASPGWKWSASVQDAIDTIFNLSDQGGPPRSLLDNHRSSGCGVDIAVVDCCLERFGGQGAARREDHGAAAVGSARESHEGAACVLDGETAPDSLAGSAEVLADGVVVDVGDLRADAEEGHCCVLDCYCLRVLLEVLDSFDCG